MSGILARVVCIVALAGCVTTYHIDIDGYQLHQKSRELRTKGQAVVEGTRYTSSSLDHAKPWAEPVTIDQEVTDKQGRTRWVRDLLRGCADDDSKAESNVDCELDKPMSYYRTRTWEKRSTTRFVQYTLGAAISGVLVGAIACNAFCDEDTTIHDVSEVAVVSMGVALGAILLWGIIDCAGKWGEPGCRD
jgi:hypothetical protein